MILIQQLNNFERTSSWKEMNAQYAEYFMIQQLENQCFYAKKITPYACNALIPSMIWKIAVPSAECQSSILVRGLTFRLCQNFYLLLLVK